MREIRAVCRLVLVVLSVCGLLVCSGPIGCRRSGGSDDGRSDSSHESGQRRRGGPGENDKKDGPGEFLTPVVVQRVDRGTLQVTVSTTANVIPVRSESLQSMESGILVFTRPWEEGEQVSSGTLIATLDNEDLRKQHETAEADLRLQEQNLDIQRIRLRQAEREYVIIQDLYARGLAPLRDVESSKLALENSRNSLNQARINLEKAKLALRTLEERFQFLEIRAPFTGLLVSRSTIEGRSGWAKTFGSEPLRSLEGRFVNKSTVLFGIMDTTQMLLKCDVTSKDIAKIRVGQKAFGIVYGRENINVEGEVVSMSTNVNIETRAFEVDVLVPNPDGRMRPGMFGRMEIVVEELEDVIAIPKTVIQRRGGNDIVFVVDRPEGLPHPVASQVAVDLGMESKSLVAVDYGLKKGDELVVRGYEILQDRIPIQVAYADEPTT